MTTDLRTPDPPYTPEQIKYAAVFGITVPELSRWIVEARLADLADLEADIRAGRVTPPAGDDREAA